MEVVPHFGLHPWWITRYRSSSSASSGVEDWEAELRGLLRDIPSAGVGECRLDKGLLRPRTGGRTGSDGVAVPVEEQLDILRRHAAIAAQPNRVLTVHCVGL